jgi:uncharacterized protein YbaR (Trm112 family)
MAIHDLLGLLACPACRGPVRLLEGEAGVACEGCRRVYPIEDGILGMLVEKATIPAS